MSRTLAAALTAALLLPAAASRAAEWPTFLGPNRDGLSPDTGLLKQWPEAGPPLLWKHTRAGAGWSSVAIAAGLVYTTGNEDGRQMLICLDDRDGTERWRVAQGPAASHNKYPGARATPTVDGDRLYLTGGDGLVTCHRTRDGGLLWKTDMRADLGGRVGGWLYAESVTILGPHALVMPGGERPVVALDKLTGKPVWSSDKPATAGYCSVLPVTLNGQTALICGTQSGLLALDARTGKELYRHPFADGNVANAPTPAFADGHLFWAVGYRKGGLCLKVSHDLGAWRFNEAWTTSDFASHPGNYVVAGGRIYGKGRGGLVCADLKTGQTLWTERGGAGQATWADGLIYSFADQGGKLTLLDPAAEEGARVKGTLQVAGAGNSWSHPVVVNGRLYLRYDTNLSCYDVRAR